MSLELFQQVSDLELLTICIYGEARGEGLDGMCAVGAVILNRAKKGGWFGDGIKGVILKPKQFSCFNGSDPNAKHLEALASACIAGDFITASLGSDDALRACYWVAKGLLANYLRSNVNLATHYNTKGCDPGWDDKMKLVKVIGHHEFFEA